jgi:hypothetical protein
MATSVENLLANVSEFRYNPSGIQKSALAVLREVSAGEIDIVDPTNPVVFCLEASAINTAAFMIENKTLNRKQYPFAAQTSEELYPHMSDKDYVDRFAVPATTRIFFLISQNELLEKLVPEPGNTGISKLVLPRNTFVTVADGAVFSIQYPLEIRRMAHGGLQIVHVADQVSPLQTLTTNLVPWTVLTADDGIKYIGFELEMQQFSILSRTASANQATGLKLDIDFQNQFYYCRVWVDNGDNTFTEIQTTHTDEVYDSRVLTAVLKVVDQRLTVKIPQIYMSLGLLNKSIRVDVYQTLGPISIELGNYQPDQFVATFHSLNKAELDAYVAPLKAMRSLRVHSTKIASGGSNAMTFEQLRQRVIRNAIGSPNLPITNVQIESALARQGYQVVKNIDNITNRVFLATRAMPTPDADSELITAAAAGIGMLSTRLADAVLLDSIIDNGNIITITPDTLYRRTGGVIQLVPTAEVATVRSLAPDQQAITVNNGGYMYSPFHYVLDSTGNEFTIRPYYLDNPIVESKSFIGENDTTLYQVSTGSYLLTRTATGYKLRIQTSSSDEFKALDDSEVFVQLAFLPTGDNKRAYMLGELIGLQDDERVYEFDLSTNYAISKDHELAMLKFMMFDLSDRVINLPLLTDFDIIYSTNVAMGPQWQANEIDSKLGYFQLPDNVKAITNEQFKIRLGYHLDYLWTRVRSVVTEESYERWEVDVPAVYESDVYERDLVTGAAFTIVAGELVYTIIHHKDDPVLDDNDDPVFKFRKGDVKFDTYGAPILKNGRDMQRQMEIFLVEGSYYFATNQVSADYRQRLVRTIVDWLIDDLPNMGDNLLEQTRIYYYPTTTLGSVDVMFSSGLVTSLNAGQEFEVTLHVRGSVYSNLELRSTIVRKTIETISKALESKTISMSNVINDLRVAYEADVISLEIRGLGGNSNLNVVTMMDDASRLSIKKQLVARSDETLGLADAVSVDFIRHERSNTFVQ